jgi:hypothetical protein
MLVQFASVVNMPASDLEALYRPEAVTQAGNPVNEGIVSKTTLLKTFAPGDVLASLEFNPSFNIVFRLLESLSGLKGNQVVRNVCRRDFPSPGRTCVAFTTLGMGGWEDDMCTYGLLMAPTEEGHTLVREIFDMPARYSWLLANKSLEKQLQQYYDPKRLEEIKPSICHALHEESGFLVVALKKVCSGPPLVPRLASELQLEENPRPIEELDKWKVFEGDGDFNFSSYLQHLMVACGMRSDQVFASLDGRHLVSYQAAVRRAHWHLLWKSLEPVMKRHQSVYRRKYGGSGAPNVQVDVTPRFKVEQDSPVTRYTDSPSNSMGKKQC